MPAEILSSISCDSFFNTLSGTDVPSAPSAIAMLLCTGSEMVLGWRAPACSGGDPVRGYYLDQREKGMKTWREVDIRPVKERQVKVSTAVA